MVKKNKTKAKVKKINVAVLVKKNFKCEGCFKEMSLDDATYDITVEKYYEPNRGSGIEFRLCSKCAEPMIKLIGKVKALRSMKPMDKPKIDTNTNKYDEINEGNS